VQQSTHRAPNRRIRARTGSGRVRSRPEPRAQPRSLWSSDHLRTPAAQPRSEDVLRGSALATPPPSLQRPALSSIPGAIDERIGNATGRAAATLRTLGTGAALAALLAGSAFAGYRFTLAREGLRAPGAPEKSTPAPALASARAARLGALELRTQPAGASVLIDGNPTGLATPATITGLPPDRTIEVRLEKPGFRPIVQSIRLASGPGGAGNRATERTFDLVATSGTVRFQGLPARAEVFLDGDPVDLRLPVTAPLGRHHLRVDTRTSPVFSRVIDVKPGEQTLVIGPDDLPRPGVPKRNLSKRSFTRRNLPNP
jgi:hypothetical protein